jgi:hypothetical protein
MATSKAMHTGVFMGDILQHMAINKGDYATTV